MKQFSFRASGGNRVVLERHRNAILATTVTAIALSLPDLDGWRPWVSS